MAQSLAQIFVHIIYHVHDVKIRREHLDELWAYTAGIARGLQSKVTIVGGEPDHIHILCTLPRNITVSDFMEEIKKNSSKWLKSKDTYYHDFYWQRGYGIFSVSQSKVDIVNNYISNQEEHHKKMTFQDEYIQWLKEYNIDYDERYVLSD